MSILERKHPLEDIYKWQRKLDRVIQKVRSDIKPDRTGYAWRQVRLQLVSSAASRLRLNGMTALRRYHQTGIVYQTDLWGVAFRLRELRNAIETNTVNPASGTPVRPKGTLWKLFEIIVKMEAALVRLSKDGVWGTTVRERRIRDALRKLQKRLADVVSTKEIAEWCSLFPGLDLKVPGQIERLATTIWLSRIRDQTWEVRYRSAAPGHPMRLVVASLSFPNIDLLEECYNLSGRPKELYVAAALPRWRVVWKISTEDFYP